MTSGDDPQDWAAQGIEQCDSGRPQRSHVAHIYGDLTPEEEQEAWRLVNLYGPANCWTGNVGRLATFLHRFLMRKMGG